MSWSNGLSALNAAAVQNELQRFMRAPDFETYVGHADASERNFYEEWGDAEKK